MDSGGASAPGAFPRRVLWTVRRPFMDSAAPVFPVVFAAVEFILPLT